MSAKGFRAIMKNKKALAEVMELGKQYDRETDPVKKEALKQEIEARCAAIKGKLQGEVSQNEPDESNKELGLEENALLAVGPDQ